MDPLLVCRSRTSAPHALQVTVESQLSPRYPQSHQSVFAPLSSPPPSRRPHSVTGFWCSAGKRFGCVRGTYNNLTGADDQSYCTLCPTSSSTLAEATTHIDDCLCAPGFYTSASADGTVACAECPIGTACEQSGGHMLSRLPLQRGFWRSSNQSTDVRRCPDSGRNSPGYVGTPNGTHSDQCKVGLAGPYCRLCSVAAGHYFNEQNSACEECSQRRTPTQLLFLLLAMLLLLLSAGALVYLRRKSPRGGQISGQIRVIFVRLKLKTKLKTLYSMYQISTRVPTIYQVQLLVPESVQQLLRTFELSMDIGFEGLASRQLQCFNLHGFSSQLLVYMLLPPLMLLATFLVFLCLAHRRALPRATKSKQALSGVGGEPIWRQALLRAAPWMLLVAFLAFPVVSSYAFRAFLCEAFDDDVRYLRADYSVNCDSEEYAGIEALAWLAIVMYPVGVCTGLGVLLFNERHVLWNDHITPQTKALAFLHRELRPQYFWCAAYHS